MKQNEHIATNVAKKIKKRSQAVARISDCTASSTFGAHVTSSVTWPFDDPYIPFLWNQAAICNGFRDPSYSTSNITQWLT